MKDWRAWAEGNGWGIDFHDGYPPLLDLRFADDILIFSGTAEGAALLLDALITILDNTGLKLNASMTVIWTTEAQPPDHITTPAGHTIVVKDTFGTHKWLGCMLSALGSGNVDADITYHLQAAARAFHSNKWIFLDKNASCRRIVWVRSSTSWMKFCTKELSRPHGVKHCSKCFPKLTVLASQLIFGQLQTYAYCTKSLPIWCLVGLRRRWSNTSLRNSMDSGAVGGLKNICWQQT